MSDNAEELKVGLPAAEFEQIFRKADVLTPGLDSAKSASAKAIRIGKFLAPNIGREVPISVNGHTGTAKLCMTQSRAKQKLYYFDVRWSDADVGAASAAATAPVELKDGLDTSGSGNTGAGGDATDSGATAGPEGNRQEEDAGSGNEEEW
jgi:hypothetical protein